MAIKNTVEKMMTQPKDTYWFAFVRQHLEGFVNSLSNEDKNTNAEHLLNDIDYLALLAPREASKYLRTYLEDAVVKRFFERFRADKYRKKRNKKTLQINALTHQKIMDFKSIIEADTVDEALDVAFSRKYSLEADEVKKEFGERIYDEENTGIQHLANRLGANDRNRLFLMIEEAFRDGWKAAKSSRQRKGNPVLQALENNEKYKALKFNK